MAYLLILYKKNIGKKIEDHKMWVNTKLYQKGKYTKIG
jgi:hypothetical protein